jgi:hypothetical protein
MDVCEQRTWDISPVRHTSAGLPMITELPEPAQTAMLLIVEFSPWLPTA